MVIGRIEEKNECKYLVVDSADENKELLTKITDLWDGIEDEIQTINGGKEGEYGKSFRKTKFNLDDDLQLDKQLKFPAVAIVVRSVFEEDSKYYPQIYLNESLYEL